MGTTEKLVEGLAAKSADDIEKFAIKLLSMAEDHWGEEAAAAYKKAHESEDPNPKRMKWYYDAFRNWHALRQVKSNLHKWSDPTRSLPARYNGAVVE